MIQVQPASSSEVLELLLGLDRAQASALIGNLPQGQRPERPEDSEGRRPTAQLHPGTQSTNRSEFERAVMETMQRLSERLDSLADRVERRDERSNVTATESPGASGSTTTLWADRPLDEPLDSLPMPRWDDEEPAETESRALIQVSESTRRALKTAFEKPLPNAARLQTIRAYPFPMVEDT